MELFALLQMLLYQISQTNSMGNHQIVDNLQQFRLQLIVSQEWTHLNKAITHNASSSNGTNSISLQNINNGMVIDGYWLTFQSQIVLQQYLATFAWRNQCRQLVQGLYLMPGDHSNICSSGNNIWIYLEHVHIRLTKLTDFPYPQNLLVLRECLIGYKHIYSNFKYFKVREGQICFTEEGLVRVWVNQHLQVNQSQQIQVFKTQLNIAEVSVVRDIIDLISQNTDKRYQPIDFHKYLLMNGCMSPNFSQALTMINKYANDHRTIIPDRLNSILSLISQQRHLPSQKHSNSQTRNHPYPAPQAQLNNSEPVHQKHQLVYRQVANPEQQVQITIQPRQPLQSKTIQSTNFHTINLQSNYAQFPEQQSPPYMTHISQLPNLTKRIIHFNQSTAKSIQVGNNFMPFRPFRPQNHSQFAQKQNQQRPVYNMWSMPVQRAENSSWNYFLPGTLLASVDPEIASDLATLLRHGV